MVDVVIGIGETGKPWFNLMSKKVKTIAVDIQPSLSVGEWDGRETVERLHICFPYTINFGKQVIDYAKKYSPKTIIIHSTVKPYTTMKLSQDNGLLRGVNLVYSPIRGIHARMETDLKRYDKFYASYGDDCSDYENLLLTLSLPSFKVEDPLTLEYAKILADTSYYGWLITWAMKTEEIALKHGLNYDEMWMFAYQIHKFLDNRPPCGSPGYNKLYADPKGIGGHCVLPNLELIKDDLGEVYSLIHRVNNDCIQRHNEGD